MSTTAQAAKLVKLKKKSKLSNRVRNRCEICKRPRAYNRMTKLCRICLRREALAGNIPGMTKLSW